MNEIDNLGVPPLAGISTYEEASRPGLGVDASVERLRRLEYVLRRLHLLCARLLPTVPEWEVKCGLGVHSWVDAEACGSIRNRINELRHPSLRFDDSPDERLTTRMDELVEAGSTVELLAGLERVHSELAASIDEYVGWRIRSPISQPSSSCDASGASRRTCSSGRALPRRASPSTTATRATSRVPLPTGGRDDITPRRDRRFRDRFNTSAKIDRYYSDESRPADERAFALAYKRLREMDVPEWMGPILAAASDRPWEYHTDLSRQLCDETRHAMMGEVVLHSHGVPHYAFPVPINAVEALNSEFDPREAHLLLWGIEQSLMPADTGSASSSRSCASTEIR